MRPERGWWICLDFCRFAQDGLALMALLGAAASDLLHRGTPARATQDPSVGSCGGNAEQTPTAAQVVGDRGQADLQPGLRQAEPAHAP